MQLLVMGALQALVVIFPISVFYMHMSELIQSLLIFIEDTPVPKPKIII